MRGVFLVAAELSELGFVVSPTSRSAQGVDLLAFNGNGTRTFAVEVKSTTKSSFWIIGKKAREKLAKKIVWVFVKFEKPRERSRFFIIPSKTLQRYIKKGWQKNYIVRRNAIEKFEDKWAVFGKTTG